MPRRASPCGSSSVSEKKNESKHPLIFLSYKATPKPSCKQIMYVMPLFENLSACWPSKIMQNLILKIELNFKIVVLFSVPFKNLGDGDEKPV